MKKKIYNLTLSSILLSILIIGSKITIPLGMIPFTLQTFVVLLIPLLVSRRNAIMILVTYILMGIIGIPVFSGGGGFFYLAKPFFGFILGFGICMGIPKGKTKQSKLVFSFLRLSIIYLIAVIYMLISLYPYNGFNLIYILEIAILPFIAKDCLSLFLSYFISLRLEPILHSKEFSIIIDKKL